MYSRRTFLKISASITALVAGGYFFKSSGGPKVKHILSSASHERLSISLSLSKSTSKLELLLNDRELIQGKKTDREGKHWQFLSNKLQTKAQEVQQQVVGTLTPTFQKVLGELIAQKEYEMIVAPGALLYADPDLDITEEVIAYLDNALTEKSE